MIKSKQRIIHEIEAYVEGTDADYDAWYVGVASNAADRLFGDHNVKERGDRWIYRECSSWTEASEIECHFVIELGTDGGTSESNAKATWVYAYRKSTHTEP